MSLPAETSTEYAPLVAAWVAIVDDHPAVRASLGRALRFEGLDVKMFASAEEFLEHAAPSAASCIVLDMQLPRMSGHELMHFLERERAPAPPVIFITAHDDMLAAVGACCAPYGQLRKPFEIEALLRLIRPLLAAAGKR